MAGKFKPFESKKSGKQATKAKGAKAKGKKPMAEDQFDFFKKKE